MVHRAVCIYCERVRVNEDFLGLVPSAEYDSIFGEPLLVRTRKWKENMTSE